MMGILNAAEAGILLFHHQDHGVSRCQGPSLEMKLPEHKFHHLLPYSADT
jgi:hypothetical protein